MNQPTPEALRVAESARSIALQMLEERGRGAVLVGVARVDAALEVLLKAVLAPPSGSETLFFTDRPLGSFGARIALAQRLGLINHQVERALHTLRKVRNAFAHTTTVASLAEASYQQPLGDCYRHARENPLWGPLERILNEQLQPNGSAGESKAPARFLRDYILLITILVAFLEAAAQQLRPMQPPVVMGFAGITKSNSIEAG
ncbi:hypothetical protein KBY70_08590 [Cyanobium sp. ATX 6E8]|uniref:hypothetical protein n=1 Tax=Cyanobium sp. ATX 6E8 TaxID=2823701 RepID=UPI0020CCF03C|nr:hypothetical protein [Cyanobium sp. ATX 6E8]MCP9942443.1 hypothetical protein [Cyanobium sp. ATX 6E8]